MNTSQRDDHTDVLHFDPPLAGNARTIVQQEPRAWECPECGNARRWAVTKCNGAPPGLTHPLVGREAGTPLYAAPVAETEQEKP